jgi:hypothetical protein
MLKMLSALRTKSAGTFFSNKIYIGIQYARISCNLSLSWQSDGAPSPPPQGESADDAMDAAMVSDNCPDEQPSDPLKTFVARSPELNALECIGTSTGPILYPPNTRMKDFSGNIVKLRPD